MQEYLPKIYCFVNEFNLSDLCKLSKNINIIYRNYDNIDNLHNIIKLKSYCRKIGHKLYLSNDIKLSIQLNLDGVYIPSFNKQINYCKLYKFKKKFRIIGSAHNLSEIRIKKNQGCKEIFLSPIFKVGKSKYTLGVPKFNLISFSSDVTLIALGGINQKNFKQLRSLRIKGFASISWAKKNGLKLIRPF